MSFLEKFEGKTSKIGKQGVHALINETANKPLEQEPVFTAESSRKRPSGNAIE